MSALAPETRRLRIRAKVLSLLAELAEDGVGDAALATVIAYQLMPEVDEQIKSALLDTAEDLRVNASAAWGGGAAWFTTGRKVGALAADWVTDRANNP